LTKKRIARFSAFVRNHSRRVFVPESGDFEERLARFRTWRLWPAVKSAHRCADSGMCMGESFATEPQRHGEKKQRETEKNSGKTN
jgi:hypothetical protein